MKKTDYKKEFAQVYKTSSKRCEIVDIPSMKFFMIDGEGDPNTAEAFREAVECLFSLSYSLKFMIKKSSTAVDYGVLPLEGLWWVDNMSQFSIYDKEAWKWTLMIMQPDLVTVPLFEQAAEQVRAKKNPVALEKIRFEVFSEGLSAQILHIGPFSEEGPTVERLHQFIQENGFKRSGMHHEIYLSDIRRANPDKWKTIIRQPIVKEK